MLRAFNLIHHVKPIIYKPSFTVRSFKSGRETVDYTVKDGVAVVKFDNKKEKMNWINERMINEMKLITNKIFNNPSVSSVVLISGKLDNFIAGVDIRMLERVASVAEGVKLSKGKFVQGSINKIVIVEMQQMTDQLATSSKPVVAAIMGQCLGAGLEVALACHYRIAVNVSETRFGFPEVDLVPGAGGTQRLPGLLGTWPAVSMMLRGNLMGAKKATRKGLVDQVIKPTREGPEKTLEYLEEVAIQAAKDLASGKLKPNRQSTFSRQLCRVIDCKYPRDAILGVMKLPTKKWIGYVPIPLPFRIPFPISLPIPIVPIPFPLWRLWRLIAMSPAQLRVIRVVKEGVDKGMTAGLDAEAKAFGRNLLYYFFGK